MFAATLMGVNIAKIDPNTIRTLRPIDSEAELLDGEISFPDQNAVDAYNEQFRLANEEVYRTSRLAVVKKTQADKIRPMLKSIINERFDDINQDVLRTILERAKDTGKINQANACRAVLDWGLQVTGAFFMLDAVIQNSTTEEQVLAVVPDRAALLALAPSFTINDIVAIED